MARAPTGPQPGGGAGGGLTVAVTGPSGEIGRAFVRALERAPEIEQVRAFGRREVMPSRARCARWRPRFGARETLRATIAEARSAQLLR